MEKSEKVCRKIYVTNMNKGKWDNFYNYYQKQKVGPFILAKKSKNKFPVY